MTAYRIQKLLRKYVLNWRRIRQLWRAVRRRRNRRRVALAGGVSVLIAIIALGAYLDSQPRPIARAAYVPILEVIADAESQGNYNAYFGNGGNNAIRFTEMTIDEVLRWQQAYVDQGHYSSAVGRYQIVKPTLEGLVQRMGLSQDAVFDADLQDRMAIVLLERRGSQDFADNELSREQFAANLAQEWASLPRAMGDSPEESFYANDGVNKSLVSLDEVYNALAPLSIPR